MPFNDPITLVMIAVLVVLIFFMFRNSRKRQKDAAALREKVVPGAHVMTSFGLYGTLLSIDEEQNQVELEAAPGVVLTLHRQTVTRVVDPVAPADDLIEETPADTGTTVEPEYGQRVEPTTDTTAAPKNPGAADDK